MNDIELSRVVDAWIKYEEAEDGSPEREENWWAVEQTMDWWLEGDPESLWQFVLIAYKREMSNKARAILAAGPIEDLLAHFGPAYIDRVEQLAREDSQFNWLLGGVWRNSMTDDVWQRVQHIRKEVW